MTKYTEIVSLADLGTNYGGITNDEAAPPQLSKQFDILAKAHAIYLEELPPGENLEFLTGKHNYEIKTNGGGRIYVASDVSEEFRECIFHGGKGHHNPFCFKIFDFVGRQILNINGHLAGCGVSGCVNVYSVNANIGSIIQGNFNSPHYLVVNWEGKEIYSIHHGKRGTFWHNLKLERVDPTEFGIYTTSEIEKKLLQVGKFFPIQTQFEFNPDSPEENTCDAVKLIFPSHCDLTSKLLLLAALFVIDYRIVRRAGRRFKLRGHRKCDRFLTIPCVGITFSILAAIVIIIILIVELVVHYETPAKHGHT